MCKGTVMRAPAVLALLVAVVLVAGCSGTGKPASKNIPASMVGETFLGGQLQIVSITEPSESRPEAVFVLANVADEKNEGLIARVTFYTPPPPLEPGQLETPWETHNTEQRVTFYKDEGDKPIVAPLPKGVTWDRVWGVKLQIFSEPTVARGEGTQGTLYFDKKLECVAMTNRLLALEPSISFTLENVSGESIDEELQYMLELHRKEGVWNTGWQFMESPIPPGGTVKIEPDLSGAETGRAKVRLRVRVAP